MDNMDNVYAVINEDGEELGAVDTLEEARNVDVNWSKHQWVGIVDENSKLIEELTP